MDLNDHFKTRDDLARAFFFLERAAKRCLNNFGHTSPIMREFSNHDPLDFFNFQELKSLLDADYHAQITDEQAKKLGHIYYGMLETLTNEDELAAVKPEFRGEKKGEMMNKISRDRLEELAVKNPFVMNGLILHKTGSASYEDALHEIIFALTGYCDKLSEQLVNFEHHKTIGIQCNCGGKCETPCDNCSCDK